MRHDVMQHYLALLLLALLGASRGCRPNVGDGCFETPGDKAKNLSSCCLRAASASDPKPGPCDCAQPALVCNYTSELCALHGAHAACPADGDRCEAEADCHATSAGCFAAEVNRTDKRQLANHSSCCPFAPSGGPHSWRGGLHCNTSAGVCYGGQAQPVCGVRGHPCGARLSACCGSMLCRLQDDGSEICTADIPRRGLNASQGIAVRNPRRLPALLPVLQRTTLPGYTDSPGR